MPRQGYAAKSTCAEDLARLVVGGGWDDLPSRALHPAKRSLMNIFAAALAGCRDATVETALASLAAFSGGGRQATLIGRRERIDALAVGGGAAVEEVVSGQAQHICFG
ncbi:MAG: MmgE/PrpD family protein [Xanthobacteraceae bacterium]